MWRQNIKKKIRWGPRRKNLTGWFWKKIFPIPLFCAYMRVRMFLISRVIAGVSLGSRLCLFWFVRVLRLDSNVKHANLKTSLASYSQNSIHSKRTIIPERHIPCCSDPCHNKAATVTHHSASATTQTPTKSDWQRHRKCDWQYFGPYCLLLDSLITQNPTNFESRKSNRMPPNATESINTNNPSSIISLWIRYPSWVVDHAHKSNLGSGECKSTIPHLHRQTGRKNKECLGLNSWPRQSNGRLWTSIGPGQCHGKFNFGV